MKKNRSESGYEALEAKRPRLALRLWRRMILPKVRANDNHSALNHLYAMEDPWQMSSGKEQSRFIQTNELISRHFGHLERILEIGCGEGHQSEYLARLCERLDGLDVSARAVARAKTRLPSARFSVGEVGEIPWGIGPEEKYDLVVACEVLYYLSDVPKAIESMSRVGKACLVTFFAPSARRIAAPLDEIDGLEKGWIHHGSETWLWALWRPANTKV